MDIVKQLYKDSRPFKPCSLFKGTETFREMMNLFLTPQGIEFCIANDFPSRGRLRAIKEAGVSEMGIWIDEGVKRAENARIAVLIGNTEGDLYYDTLDYPCRVVLMKGAKCTVHASGYAVVSVTAQDGCEVVRDVKDKAVVR